jgi:hypothetical protein
MVDGKQLKNKFLYQLQQDAKIQHCKEVETFLSEEFLYGVVVHHISSCDLGCSCSVPEELPTHDNF